MRDHHHAFDERAFKLEGFDPLDAAVLENFRRAGHFNRMMFGRVVGHDRPGHGQALMLLALARVPEGVTQRDLAGTMRLSPPTVTVALQKLEADGLIERWTDEEDQRLTRIRMTDAGREAQRRIASSFSDLARRSVGKMSEDDRRELARLLGVFADNVQALLDEKGE
jgi:DNA-binding MarR family transcriptional regulator